MRERYLTNTIKEDSLHDHKMAFISGPRQVGKTSLALQLIQDKANYFNWDEAKFKKAWVKDPYLALQSIAPGPIVFDELHKYRFWKRSLKGLYDRIGQEVPMIVTGSAKLDLYKKGGDSLLGRYIPYRLYPFSVAESPDSTSHPDKLCVREIQYPLQDLMKYTAFPEPLLAASEKKAARWSRLRLERLVREDIRDFKNIRDLELMKLLLELLPDRVASPLSINSLKEDIQVAYATVRDWMEITRQLYITFAISPYSKNIARALTKERKYYLFDWYPVEDPGAKLENIVALHLLKACHFWTDTAIDHFELTYIRTKEKLELDFCLLRNKKPWILVECKSNQTAISPALKKIAEKFPKASAYQLTLKDIDRKIPGTQIRIINVEKFLSMLV